MDNLTAQKKYILISDCINARNALSKNCYTIRKMYKYLHDRACNSTTSSEIASLEIVKISLDFLVRGVLNEKNEI